MSKIKVDEIVDEAGTGAPSFPNGIPAADLTGTLPAIDGSALTGVGGATSLITDWTDITSGAASFTINFTDDCDVYYIQFQDIKVTGTATNLLFCSRLTDSSDTVISGATDYKFARSYLTSQSVVQTSVFTLAESVVGQSYSGVTQRSALTGAITICNPKSSTAYTSLTQWNLQIRGTNANRNMRLEGFLNSSSKVNNGIVFFEYYGETFVEGKYRVYGVDL